jgi:hypothetical protein
MAINPENIILFIDISGDQNIFRFTGEQYSETDIRSELGKRGVLDKPGNENIHGAYELLRNKALGLFVDADRMKNDKFNIQISEHGVLNIRTRIFSIEPRIEAEIKRQFAAEYAAFFEKVTVKGMTIDEVLNEEKINAKYAQKTEAGRKSR